MWHHCLCYADTPTVLLLIKLCEAHPCVSTPNPTKFQSWNDNLMEYPTLAHGTTHQKKKPPSTEGHSYIRAFCGNN